MANQFLAGVIYNASFIAAISCALIAGIFFIFSNTVMPSLAQLSYGQGVKAMQNINNIILNPLFFIIFIGPALISLILLSMQVLSTQLATSIPLIVACLSYFIGSFVVTIIFNVPMNDELKAIVHPHAFETSQIWSRYLKDWVFWNNVRAIASLVASASFIFALI